MLTDRLHYIEMQDFYISYTGDEKKSWIKKEPANRAQKIFKTTCCADDMDKKIEFYTPKQGYRIAGYLLILFISQAYQHVESDEKKGKIDYPFSHLLRNSDCNSQMSWMIDDPALPGDWLESVSRVHKIEAAEGIPNELLAQSQLFEVFKDFIFFKMAKFGFDLSLLFIFFNSYEDPLSDHHSLAVSLWQRAYLNIENSEYSQAYNQFNFYYDLGYFNSMPILKPDEVERANQFIRETESKRYQLKGFSA